MLHDLSWLQQGQPFPPLLERDRLERYAQNAALFNNDQFAGGMFRQRDTYPEMTQQMLGVYSACAERISQVIGNFDDIISFPVLLNYQRFMSLKIADLVAGEHPLITGATDTENAKIKWLEDSTNFFEKLYSIVIDLSRFGDCPIRVYKDAQTGYYTFTIWDAMQWYPIVSQDGTDTIKAHCLVWTENKSQDDQIPDLYVHVQVHSTDNPGVYDYYVFHNGSERSVMGELVEGYPKHIATGLKTCAVMSLRQYAVSGTVYGYDDYVPIDAIMAEIITRVSQISVILDKHADPSMTGPVSMLRMNTKTGERYLERSKFYGINPEDEKPEYLTWDGQLEASFKELEFLVNQLYILSEMGAALTGGQDSATNAVSGTAMRFKMVNPLAKARRISNALTMPLRRLVSVIGSNAPDIDESTSQPSDGEDTELPFGHVSLKWKDGLPDDPREQLEMCKLASGKASMLPLEDCLMAYLGKTSAEAGKLAIQLRNEAQADQAVQSSQTSQQGDTNKPGPQDGTGVNPQKKGSTTGITNFQSENNKNSNEK